MRYAQMRSMDISNGEGTGVALFVQGCKFHCKNCFNSETWDFTGGLEWTEETKQQFIELANKPYIKRISILGGEPLVDENLDGVLDLVKSLKALNKPIWIYSGYVWESIFNNGVFATKECSGWKRREIVKNCDILVDGQFIDELKDLRLKFRGSSNQRVIDIQQSIESGNLTTLYN